MSRSATATWILPAIVGALIAAISTASALAQPPEREVDEARGTEEAPADAWALARGSLAGTGRSATLLRPPLAEAWRRDFEKTAFGAVPVIAGGTIFIGDLDGRLHALSLEDGTTRWTFTADQAGFPSAAAVSNLPDVPLIVIGDDVGMVRALDLHTGEVRWTHETGGEISGAPMILPTPAGPRVLVGSQDASLTCLELAAGTVVWKHSIADQIRCAPTVERSDAGDRVFLAGCDGRLHVIDAANGEEVTTVGIDGPTGTTPAAAAGRVFFGTEGGAFYAIDHRAGEIAWRVAGANGQAYRSNAAIADGLVIVGSRARAVEALALDDGARRWRHPMRGRVDASPIVVRTSADGQEGVIAADAAGTVALLTASTGEPLWEFDAGGGFSGGAAAAGGRLVLAGDDGRVWCFQGAP